MNAFTDAIMAVLGYAPADTEPGVITRFATSRRRAKDGWCVLFWDRQGGAFGCYRTGVNTTWQASRQRPLTSAERIARAVAIEQATKQRHAERTAHWADNLKKWGPVWRSAAPLQDCAAANYMERRGFKALSGRWPPSLRCTRLDYWQDGHKLGTFAVMLSAVQGADGRMVALHRTYLNDDGTKANVPTVKKLSGAFGAVVGGAVRLFSAAERIGVAEGIETAVAAYLGSGIPTWAAVSAGGLEALLWPAPTRDLFVFADNDDNQRGQQAAQRLACRAASAGLAVRVLTPTEAGSDWADVFAEATV